MLTGIHGKHLEKAVKEDFPFLPSGCQVRLDKQTQEVVLENLKSQIANRWAQIVAQLRLTKDDSLDSFLESSGLELSDILRRGSHSWTKLRQDAGLATLPGSDLEEKLLKRVRAFAHVDDPLRAAVVSVAARGRAHPRTTTCRPPNSGSRGCSTTRSGPTGVASPVVSEGFDAMRHEPAARAEISSVVDLSFEAARHVPYALEGSLADVPLQIHARYQREEILAALDFPRLPNSFREGVFYFAERNVDAFFITLKKSEADYSPTTMYADYPISRDLFHWESQSTTSVNSPTGRRYLDGSSTVLLFVRQEQKDDFGTSPYLFLGPASYVSHTGDRPIAITWKLRDPDADRLLQPRLGRRSVGGRPSAGPSRCRTEQPSRTAPTPVVSGPSCRIRSAAAAGAPAALAHVAASQPGASWCRRSCRAGSRRRCR